MSIIKEKIPIFNKDVYLTIKLKNKSEVYGYDQEIKKYVKDKESILINPIKDYDILTFNYNTDLGNIELNPYFYSIDEDPEYKISYMWAGFTEEELFNYTLNLRNSFYILEFFDGYKTNTRKKIFTKYFSKIWSLGLKHSDHTNPIINETQELKQLELPRHFLTEQENVFPLYMRLLFFNGKTGRLILFYNLNNEDYKNELKNFFIFNINKEEKTWETENGDIVAYEQIIGSEYIDRLNETNKKTKDLQQSYPKADKFNYLTGKYEVSEKKN